MNLFDIPELLATQLLLLAMSIVWFYRRGDELPVITAFLLLYAGSYRYLAVTWGWANWVNSSVFGLASINYEAALHALECIVLGEVVFLFSYMLFMRNTIPLAEYSNVDATIATKLCRKAIFLGLAILLLTALSRSILADRAMVGIGLSGYSYVFLFPLALVGIGTLMIWFYRIIEDSKRLKFLAITLFAGSLWIGFNPTTRFQFVGQVVAAGIIVVAGMRPGRRMLVLLLTSVVTMLLFSFAGGLRALQTKTPREALAWERTVKAEDANMVDGMAILQRVYPEKLDYSLGLEHLEILLRPIPRFIWPEKPVGGYVNKLGLYKGVGGATLGFSPTIFGSFYAEGGVIGIILFSFAYGLIFSRIVMKSIRKPSMCLLTLERAIMIASLIPLLRGGDLPGIFAWIGMSFWPCFLFMWLYQKEVRKARMQQPWQVGDKQAGWEDRRSCPQ